jgi:hypothetical protein
LRHDGEIDVGPVLPVALGARSEDSDALDLRMTREYRAQVRYDRRRKAEFQLSVRHVEASVANCWNSLSPSPIRYAYTSSANFSS